MTETVIHLVRHGSKEDPQKVFHAASFSIPLSAEGVLEMNDLGNKIHKRDTIEAVYTSPYLGTADSAHILATYGDRSIPVTILDTLQKPHSEGTSELRREILRGDFYKFPPEGVIIESPGAIANRMIGAITDLRARHEGKSIALVSHADPIAFTTWRLRHPLAPFPPIQELYDRGYVPRKGSSWRITIDEQNQLLREETIRGEAIGFGKEKR